VEKDNVSLEVRSDGRRVAGMRSETKRGERFNAVLRGFVDWEKRRGCALATSEHRERPLARQARTGSTVQARQVKKACPGRT
jgi:hypothetical protein